MNGGVWYPAGVSTGARTEQTLTKRNERGEAQAELAAGGRLSRGLIVAAVGLFVLFGAYLAAGLPVGIRGEWWIEYRTKLPSVTAVILFAAAMGGLVAAAYAFDRVRRGRVYGVLGCTVLYLAVLFTGAICGPGGRAELAAPAMKRDAAGFFAEEARKIEGDVSEASEGPTSAREYLSGFPGRLAEYATDYKATVRVNNNPPGTTMVFHVARKMAETWPGTARLASEAVFGLGFDGGNVTFRATVLGSWLLLFGAALSFVPAYLAASKLTAGRGFLAAAAVCLAGSMVLFVPGKDTLQVMFFLWMFWFFLERQGNRAVLWGAFYGLAAAAAFFFTLATAVVVVVMLLGAAWGTIGQDGAHRRRELFFWLGAGGGLLGGFGLLWALWGYNSFASLWACYLNHRAFYVHFPRTYWKWVLYNPVEFAMFMGGGLFAAVVWCAARRPASDDAGGADRRTRIYLLSALAVLAVLDISGKNASEVARLWVFFMPLAALPALCLLRKLRLGARNVVLIAVVQAAAVLMLRVYLDVWRVESLWAELDILP